MPSVLVTPREVEAFAPRYRDVLESAGWSVVFPPKAEANILTSEELRTLLIGIDATIAGSEPYTADLFAVHPQLRVVARVGVGFDSVDTVAATNAGVAVCTAPGTNHESVAEHVMALMLSFTRHIVTRVETIREGGWPRHFSLPLRGQTLGLAGLGRIGKAVATRALSFGMRVIAFDPLPDHEFAKHHSIELVSFVDLLQQSDFLTLHLPLSPDTRQIMNLKAFEVMKSGSVLINTSRGGLVDEQALFETLRSEHLAGALLDVTDPEPPSPNNPLLAMPNVLVTPHAAGVDIKSIGDMARSAAEAIVSLWNGDWPVEKIVNPELRTRFRWYSSQSPIHNSYC